MAKWTKEHDGRDTEDIESATATLARVARDFSDPMATPQAKALVGGLHDAINVNLDELSRRK